VDVRVITADGVTRHSSDELETLLDGPGLVWIDVKYWDADTAAVLAKRLNLHDRAVHECAVRNPVAKVHTYPDQAFVVLHAPEQGRGGHVHFVELDQVGAMPGEPVREALVQIRAGLLRQRVVGSVADEEMPEPECMVAGERRRCRVNELFADEARQL